MITVRGPQTYILFEKRVTINKIDLQEQSEVYEGEVIMSAAEQDQIKSLLGDGKATVSVRRGIGEMSFGNGGNCSATVTITCDQSQPAIKAAQDWASYFAETAVDEEAAKMRAQVARLGISS